MLPSPLRRVAILLLPLLLAVGACTDAGELGGPTVGGAPAAKIGDVSISNADFQDEVEVWASNPQFLSAIGILDIGAPGRRSTELTAFVLSHRVVSEQAAQMGAATGYEPTQAEIDDILGQIDQGFGPVFAAFPDDFRARIGRDLAFQNNLQFLAPGDEAPPVEVNPRYGDIEFVQGGLVQVTPPEGPLVRQLDLAP